MSLEAPTLEQGEEITFKTNKWIYTRDFLNVLEKLDYLVYTDKLFIFEVTFEIRIGEICSIESRTRWLVFV